LEEAGAVVLGISYDTPDDNRAFAEAEGFPYRLLSDEDRAVSEVYGAARPPDDDWAALPRRISYLIGPDRRVVRAYEVSDAAAHPQQVLDDLRAAQGGSQG
jgi:thioredoxin-dependent peroxiredoxin